MLDVPRPSFGAAASAMSACTMGVYGATAARLKNIVTSDTAAAHEVQVSGWRLSLDPQLHAPAPATYLARFLSFAGLGCQPGQLWLRDVHEGAGGRRLIESDGRSISSHGSTPSACDVDAVMPVFRTCLQECAFGGKPRALWDELS